MKSKIQFMINEYLKLFPNEREKLSMLLNYLSQSTNEEIINWNNENGHFTAGAFVYCKKEDKFLVLYHKDLKMYLYPGGHVDKEDKSILETAKRELKEETGLENLELLSMCHRGVPFDIDIHLIPFNGNIKMPKHYHFDFRYLFFNENLSDITFDKEEFKNYKWISSKELSEDINYGNIISKLNKVLEKGRDKEEYR